MAEVPGNTGCFEVKITKETGEEIDVHSKLKGDGKVNLGNIKGLLAKIDKLVK